MTLFVTGCWGSTQGLQVPDMTIELKALTRAHAAFPLWSNLPVADRAQALRNFGDLLLTNKQSLQKLITEEIHKQPAEALAEIEKSGQAIKYFADHLHLRLQPVVINEAELKAEMWLQPLGVVLAIMPWNYPIWQVARAFLSIVGVGNTFLLKPSELVSKTSEALQSLADEALPNGVFNSFLIPHEQIENVIQDPRVQAVTLTGSTRAGRAVAAACGKSLKKVVLELGGSDPYLILKDADLEASAKICAKARLINAGQSCISAKRFLVDQSIFNQWFDIFQKEMAEQSKTLSPLANKKMKENLIQQMSQLESQGAKVLWQSQSDPHPAFYPATILKVSGSEPFMKTEELFGPVALVTEFQSEDQAIELANSTDFGLGAAVFSRDESRARRLGARIRSGLLAINDFNRSDVRLPFGGLGSSGFGRELGPWALHEFGNLRSVTGGRGC